MWYQHVCLLGIMSSILTIMAGYLLQDCQLPSVLQPQIEDLQFSLFPRIRSRLAYKAKIQMFGGVLCFFYWLVSYGFAIHPPRLTPFRSYIQRAVSFFIWHALVQPYLIIMFFVSISIMFILIEDIGILDNNLEIHWNNALTVIRNKTASIQIVEKYTYYLEQLQSTYDCCGAFSLSDWFGPDPLRDSWNNTWHPLGFDYQPWHSVKLYLPPSCCSSQLTAVCTPSLLQTRCVYLQNIPQQSYSRHAPIFPQGCVKVMTDEIHQQLIEAICMAFTIDILVNLVQMSCCFFAYYSQIRTDPNRLSRSGTHFNSQNTPSHGNSNYVSTRRLLFACQSMPLYGKLSSIQDAFLKSKARWLEYGMKIGWVFHDKRDLYISFLRRITWKSTYRSGRLEWSSLRQFLRRNLPIMEAIIYTDGDSFHEPDANSAYGSLLICLIRMACFALYGLLMAQILIAAFVPRTSKTPSKNARGTSERIAEDALFVAEEVAYLSKLFIRVTVMIAAALSKRFRCMLALLIPSLSLNVGKSYLGAELAHTVVLGPAANTERNLRAAASTLFCLMRLSRNMTNQAKQIFEESQLGEEVGEAKTFYRYIQEKSSNLTDKIDAYKESAERLMNEVKKAEQLAERAERYLRPKTSSGYADIDGQAKQRQELLVKSTEEMKEREYNNSKSMTDKAKLKLKTLLDNTGLNRSLFKSLSRKLEWGAKIERLMKRRLAATCMVFHTTRGQVCFLSSAKACERLQIIASLLTGLPILIKYRCIEQVAKGVACPNMEAVDEAVAECGSGLSKFGIRSGFGATFFQATESLFDLRTAFHLAIQKPKLYLPRPLEWVKGKAAVVSAVLKRTQDALEMILRLSMIISVSLKLLALLVFRKTSSYISKFLTDTEFDNVYVDKVFEAIDAKRHAEGRETVLPLKKFENSKVFWRRKGYTRLELITTLTSLIKVLGLGFVLSVFFFIDLFMCDTIDLLDVATSGSIQIGRRSGSVGGKQPTDSSPTVTGDGVFFHLLRKVTKVLNKISQIELNVQLSVCSPRVQYTEAYYYVRFLTIWGMMLFVSLSAGYMLRVRHMILNFFYPGRQRRRAVVLYNRLLVDRRRHMTVCRNLIIHQARQNHLQEEAQAVSSGSTLRRISPFFAKLLGKNKVKCLLCLNLMKVGQGVFICPYDDTAACMGCLSVLFQGHKTCITCLDRNPRQLFEIQRKIRKYKHNLNVENE